MQISYFEKKKKKNFMDFKFILSDIIRVWMTESTSSDVNGLPYNLFLIGFSYFGAKRVEKKYNKFWIELLDWINWEILFPWLVNRFPNYFYLVFYSKQNKT